MFYEFILTSDCVICSPEQEHLKPLQPADVDDDLGVQHDQLQPAAHASQVPLHLQPAGLVQGLPGYPHG